MVECRMKIVYPSLVQGTFDYLKSSGDFVSQQEVFRNLYEGGLIDELGEPTKIALEKGLVREFTEVEGMSFAEFLANYPLFKTFPESDFKQIEGFWEIKQSLKEQLISEVTKGKFAYDELIQLSAYFEDRQ